MVDCERRKAMAKGSVCYSVLSPPPFLLNHGVTGSPAPVFWRPAAAVLLLAALAMAGCSDIELPSWVPFQGPASDPLPGVVTPGERITELRKLSDTAAAKSPEEKQKISEQLALSIQTEKDPLVRLEIVRTLGPLPGASGRCDPQSGRQR